LERGKTFIGMLEAWNIVFHPEDLYEDQSSYVLCSTLSVLVDVLSSMFVEKSPSSSIRWWRMMYV